MMYWVFECGANQERYPVSVLFQVSVLCVPTLRRMSRLDSRQLTIRTARVGVLNVQLSNCVACDNILNLRL